MHVHFFLYSVHISIQYQITKSMSSHLKIYIVLKRNIEPLKVKAKIHIWTNMLDMFSLWGLVKARSQARSREAPRGFFLPHLLCCHCLCPRLCLCPWFCLRPRLCLPPSSPTPALVPPPPASPASYLAPTTSPSPQHPPPNLLLTPEHAVKHEHDHMQNFLITGAPIGQTGMYDLFYLNQRTSSWEGPGRSTLG
jgi:hypothetical protein